MSAGGIAVQGKDIAPVSDLDIEPFFYLMEVFIELAAEFCEPLGIVRFEDDRMGRGADVQMAY